ncbi:MAG: matrixin family metalloprotease, partial [Planctomycetota bacterium]
MTRTRTTIPLMIVVAVAFAAAPGTRGSVPLREIDGVVVKWDIDVPGQPNVVNGKITYYADPRGSLDVPSADDEVKAVRRAFATWEDVGRSAVAFEEDTSRIALKQDSTDRVNLVKWEEGTIGPFTLALAFPYSQNGVMTDADLILNDYFDWETATPGKEFHADTQAVVTHEIGHLIGLDHVPLGKSTMYFSLPLGAISTRTLEPEDENGISALYPDPDTIHQVGAIQGRAFLSGQGDDRGILIVVLDLFTRLPAASAATVEGGQYRVDSLEPGLYRVLALPLRGTGGMVPYWVKTRTDF